MQTCSHTEPKVSIGLVLSKLQKVKKTQRGWIACCPAHEDQSPSLSVAMGNDGRILLKCWTGCTFQEIVAALGFEPGDLSPGQPRPTTLAERWRAAQEAKERKEKQALEEWAKRAYLKLCSLRRIYDRSFLKPFDCDSKVFTQLLFIDHLLDSLQFGGIDEKLSCFRSARTERLGLPGVVSLA